MGPVLRAAMAGQLRKLLLGFAVILAISCGVLFLQMRGQKTKATHSAVIVAKPSTATVPPAVPVSGKGEGLENAGPKIRGPVIPAAAREAVTLRSSETPDELWKRVRRGDTRAEITLAKLYLDGNGVAQSCEQARLLLLAAAKKQSEEAVHLLSGPYALKCRLGPTAQ